MGLVAVVRWRCWAGLLMLLIGGLCEAKFKQDSDAWRELMQTPLGADAVAALQWPPLLRRNGWPEESERLRRVLVWRLLQQASGEVPDPKLTVGQALEIGAGLRHETLGPLLDSVLQRQIEPRWLQRSEPVPPEWTRGSDRLNELAPGLWWRDLDGRAGPLGLVLDVVQRGPTPLAVDALRIAAPLSTGTPAYFTCERPLRQPLGLLAAGSVTRVHCMGNVYARPGDVRLESVLATFRAGTVARIEVSAERDHRVDPVAQFGNLLERGTVSQHVEAARFSERNANCDRRNTCATSAATAAPRAQPPKRTKMSAVARNWLLLLSAFWVYCGLAMWLGNARARNVGFVLGLLALLPIGFMMGFGAGSLVSRRDGFLAGAGVVLGVPIALVWAWMGSRVMAWIYERLFGDGGLVTWVYRQLRGEFGARRT